MQNNDVITVITHAGEFVGKLKGEVGDTITILDPLMVVSTQEGQGGFSPDYCMTGQKSVDSITFREYIFAIPTNLEVVRAWRESTSGLIV